MDEDYTLDEAIEVLRAVVDRKEREIADLEKRMRRFRNADRLAEAQELLDYLSADRTAYMTVIADMTDDETILEGLDLEQEAVDCPVKYDKYLNGLDADALENELDAEEVRAEYCDEVVELMCQGIGEEVLGNKKMTALLLDDPYICSLVGEAVFYDDDLYAKFRKMVENKKDKKSKKKKKD